MVSRYPALDSFRHRAFTRQEALAQGIPAHALSSATFKAWGRGVYSIAGEPLHPASLASAILRQQGNGALAGWAAAAFYDMPTPRSFNVGASWSHQAKLSEPDLIHGTLPLHAVIPRSKRFPTVHPTMEWHKLAHDLDAFAAPIPSTPGIRIPILTPLATLLSLPHIENTTIVDLVAAADAIVRPLPRQSVQEPRYAESFADVFKTMDSARDIPGAAQLRAAAHLVRPGAHSPQETRVRILFHLAGFPESMLNTRIPVGKNEYLRAPDGQWPEARIAWEYQGSHHMDMRQMHMDDVQRSRFAEFGWESVYLFRDDLPSPRDLESMVNLWASSTPGSRARRNLRNHARHYDACRKVIHAFRAHNREDLLFDTRFTARRGVSCARRQL